MITIISEVSVLNNTEWKGHPIVFFAGVLVIYTVGNSILSLLKI